MHHDCELARDRDDCSFLRMLSSSLCNCLPVSAQIRVLSEVTEDVLRCRDQKASTEWISLFGDPCRLMLFARVVGSWHEAEICAGTPTPTDAVRIFDRQHVGKRGELAHTGDLRDDLRCRVALHHRRHTL